MKNSVQQRYVVALLSLTTFFLFADQNLTSPNLSVIADEFGFDDIERDVKLGGNIALGFFVIGGLAALLVGVLADNVNRCILFSIIVCLGESSCVCTYFVTTYDQFYYCRILTGISIGGASPIMYSLLADFFPRYFPLTTDAFSGRALIQTQPINMKFPANICIDTHGNRNECRRFIWSATRCTFPSRKVEPSSFSPVFFLLSFPLKHKQASKQASKQTNKQTSKQITKCTHTHLHTLINSWPNGSKVRLEASIHNYRNSSTRMRSASRDDD